MPDMPEKQLEEIAAERARIFTPQWFADLFGARLGYGDTFWLGNYGVLMFAVPAVVLIAGLLYAQSPAAMMPFLKIFAVALGLWRLGILQALVRLRQRVAAGGAWVVIGMLWTAGEALAAFITAARL